MSSMDAVPFGFESAEAFEKWQSRYCNRCANDWDGNCPIKAEAVEDEDEPVEEFVKVKGTHPMDIHCVEFEVDSWGEEGIGYEGWE